MFLSGKCNKSAGAPSLPVFFRQGWEATNLAANRRGIPPVAKDAKDSGFPTAGPQPCARVRSGPAGTA
jgi:hypothetical protein